MNTNQRIGLFSLVVAVSVGALGAYGFSSTSQALQSVSPEIQAGAPIMGHITLTATDSSGHIKQYVQTDNIVTSQGQDCANKSLFGTTLTACPASPGTYTVIAIGTGSTAAAKTDTKLVTELSGSGLTRAAGTANVTAATGGAGSQVSVIKTFTNTGSSQTVQEAGLFNDTTTTTDSLFARQVISPSITLNTNDALTVKWTITLGS